jgi:hypothetical protein
MKYPRFFAFFVGISILFPVAFATSGAGQTSKQPVKPPPQAAQPAKVAVTQLDLLGSPQERKFLPRSIWPGPTRPNTFATSKISRRPIAAKK